MENLDNSPVSTLPTNFCKADNEDFDFIVELISIADKEKDAHKIANAIIDEFGSFSRFSSLPMERMVQVEGVCSNIAKISILVRQAAISILRNKVTNKPIIDDYFSLYEYLSADLGSSPIEKVKIIFLDSMNQLMKDITIAEGSFDQAKVCLREILRTTLDLSASAIIMVHNHPSGPSRPSKQDIIFTKSVLSVLNAINVAVVDHIVVGIDGISSMKKLNMI